MNKNYGYIDPDYLKPELSTKLYRTTYNFIKQFYSETIFDEVCEQLKIPKTYLLDDDNWVSISFGRKFAALIKNKTADPDVYRKIGHYFFDTNNINPLEVQILKTISPLGFAKNLPKLYKRANLACDLEFKMINLSHFHITITALRGTVYSDMVLNTLGIFEGLASFYNLKNFNITSSQKIENIKEVSTFNFSVQFSFTQYVASRVLFLLMLVGYGIGCGFLINQVQNHFQVDLQPIFIGLNFLAIFLCYSLSSKLNRLKENINIYHDKGRERNFQLYQKTELLDRRYKESNMLKQLAEQLIETKNPSDVVNICLNEIETNFNYRKTAIFLVSKERKKLFMSQSRGLEKLSATIVPIELDYPNLKAKDGFFSHVLETGRVAHILDVEEYKNVLKPENRQILETLNVGSLIIAPIQTNTNKYGVLTVFRERHESTLESQDKFLIESICSLFALYFESASNFQKEVNLRSIFQKYVPKPVLEQLSSDNKSDDMFKPTKKNICSFFVDIRNFTGLSESLTPEKVFELINEYSKFLTTHLSDQGAIIDNIIGDAIVAFTVNINEDTQDHKIKIIKSVLNMIKSWDQLIIKINQLGIKKIEFGIGIHVGEATIGSVGSEHRMNYTALGDTVNTASRIQGLTKRGKRNIYSTGISVAFSKKFFEGIYDNPKTQEHRLRGKEDLMEIVVLDAALVSYLENFIEDKPQAA